MMRAVRWMLLASSLAGCSDSPASPSNASTRFPGILGTWVAFRTADERIDGGAITHTQCAERWTIKTQFAQTALSGGFLSGGDKYALFG